MRAHPTRAWFAPFLGSYGERVVYPVLHENRTLILRGSQKTTDAIPGTGQMESVRLDFSAESDENLLGDQHSLDGTAILEHPMRVKANGTVITADDMFFVSPEQTSKL